MNHLKLIVKSEQQKVTITFISNTNQYDTYFLSAPLCNWGRASKASLKLALCKRCSVTSLFIDNKTQRQFRVNLQYVCMQAYTLTYTHEHIHVCTDTHTTVHAHSRTRLLSLPFHNPPSNINRDCSEGCATAKIYVCDIRYHKSPGTYVSSRLCHRVNVCLCCTYLLSAFR